ncbi:TonB-dependent receptor [Alteraurantiacibacter aquimixticola]|uniref:TonB-dependent receptor n=1 Tax=Alteraurantiacibacter aquimixticola TaxID=2489173 RepID=A0A4T3F2I7_9SPHN|nr:TonB-dependent receptor [Alteraurantiacibacter aquimixticola]TIX51416.1 TonB-dependent receptor [Alteraurantiacibacter aquimixticola]
MTIRNSGSAGLARSFLCGVATLALAMPFAAQAQDAGAEEADDASGNQIIITATKREATLQETPVAVSVTTGETLQREEIRDLKDLQTVVPSLRVTQLQSSANTNFIIRGFGNGANNAGIEPSVGVFVDGVYRSRSAAQISDLPNVSRIEVLRGPQSTLFGKNASAGIISIVTGEPSFTTEGNAELSYGNYDAIVAKGYVTGPLSDSVAASFAAGYARRDGYNDDPASGTRTNERSRWFMRGQLLYDNGDNFSARFIADFDRIDENCCGVVNLQPSSFTQALQAVGGQVNAPADAFGDVVYNNFPSSNDVKNYGFSGQLDYDLNDALTLTSITAYRETKGDFEQDVDFTSADLLQRYNQQKLETFTQELRITADFDRVTALAGVFFFDESVREDQQVAYGADFRPFANVLTTTLLGQTLTEAEGTLGALAGDPTQYIGTFFVPGNVETGRFSLDNEALSIFAQVDFEITDGLTLTLGGNYTMDDKTGATNYQSTGVFSNLDLVALGNTAIVAQGAPQAIAIGVCQQVPVACAGTVATPAEIAALAAGTSPAGAAGAAAFPLIQAGAIAQVQAYADANDTNPAVNSLLIAQALQNFPRFVNIPNSVESGETSDNDFSYTVRLAYDISPDLNVYASYATGFKASSFALSRDSRPAPGDAAALASAGLLFNNQTFGSRFAGPEESEVIELGLKGNWGDYSMNLTGFRQDIDGFQSNVFTGTGFFLANAGKQRTYGVEFESMANPIDPLTLNLAVTWLDPSYESFPLSPFGDISGATPAGIPEWTVVIGGQWEQPLGNGDTLYLRSTYAYESETQVVDGLPGFLDPTLPDGGQAQAVAAAVPFTRQVDELSASVTYVLEDEGVEFSIWGRNLLNDRYLLSLFDSPAQPGSISGYPNQPRTYGATVRIGF